MVAATTSCTPCGSLLALGGAFPCAVVRTGLLRPV